MSSCVHLTNSLCSHTAPDHSDIHVFLCMCSVACAYVRLYLGPCPHVLLAPDFPPSPSAPPFPPLPLLSDQSAGQCHCSNGEA